MKAHEIIVNMFQLGSDWASVSIKRIQPMSLSCVDMDTCKVQRDHNPSYLPLFTRLLLPQESTTASFRFTPWHLFLLVHASACPCQWRNWLVTVGGFVSIIYNMSLFKCVHAFIWTNVIFCMKQKVYLLFFYFGKVEVKCLDASTGSTW